MPDIKHPKCNHPKCRGCTKGTVLDSYNAVGYVQSADYSKRMISHIKSYPQQPYLPTESQ